MLGHQFRRHSIPVRALALGLGLSACGFNESPQQNNLLGAATPITGNNNTVATPPAAADPDAKMPSAAAVTTHSLTAPSPVTLGALGGAVIARPRVQLVAFNHDGQAAQLQNFLVAWAASGAWHEMTAEYGVGSLAVAPLLDQAVAWASDVSAGVTAANSNTDIDAAIIANLDGADAPWGVADANTVYVLDMPTGVSVAPTPGGVAACDANLLGWHGAVALPKANLTVPYVVLATCPTPAGQNAVDSKTFALSHTLVGAVTDPTGQGYAAIDAAHAAWQLVSETPEAGGLCNQALYANAHLSLHRQDVPQAIARTWSNAAASAGHVPCVPAVDGEVFLAAAPQLHDAVAVGLGQDLSLASATTLGLSLVPGSSQDVPLALTSFPVNAGAFDVAAQEVGTSDLGLAISAKNGSHGQVLTLSVSLAAKPTSVQQVVRITASQADAAFSQYFVVRAAEVESP